MTKNPGFVLIILSKTSDITFKNVSIPHVRLLFHKDSFGSLELENSTINHTDPYKDSLRDEVIHIATNSNLT